MYYNKKMVDYVCHEDRKDHKYIDKKWIKGKWRYYYEKAKNDVSKTIKELPSTVNNALGADEKADLEAAKKKAETIKKMPSEKKEQQNQ